MWEKILRIVGGKEGELRERMFRTIILFGGTAAILGVAESFFVSKLDGLLLMTLMVLVLVMLGAMYITFRLKKYNAVTIIVFLMIVVVTLPILFFLSGGIYGASPVWFSLGILYAFVMFSGKKMVFSLLVCAIVYGITYWVTYSYPELVTPMLSETSVYIDSYFGVIVVGLIGGLVLKSHMTVFDIEHKQNIAQQKELEQSRDSKNVFFANMSHEIRTPINTIIGLNEMILRESDNTEIKAYARDIRLASNLLLGQVNDILDLSQMEMNKMVLVPTVYRTEVFFVELVELVRVRMEKKGLQFVVDIDPNIPSVLVGDARRLKQVLINLLDNALKYTEQGSVVLSVFAEEAGEETVRLKISVADSGIGIRKEDMEHIYDSFNRLDEQRNIRILGSGLGLAITKQLVELMGGEIHVDSIYTKGSTFTVTVEQKVEDATPVGQADYMSMRLIEGEGEQYRPSFEAPEVRILIVDDNAMNARVASSLLSATKVQIDIATSGAECLERTKHHLYHVILLDYMMPGMDGVETLKEIRKQENGLCRNSGVIALTANALSGAREQYQKQGFDSYVEKPIIGRALELEIFKLLPKELVEYEEQEVAESVAVQIQSTTARKRKKLYITSDGACDIPEELLDKYDVKLIYMYIQTPNGRFVDAKEIDSDSLKQYLTADGRTAEAVGVSVQEYEEFFAEALTQAEQVIHISLANYMGNSYETAEIAAQSFDHVTVIDSGQASCGQGMLVLHAAKLAMEGMEAEELVKEIERTKYHIKTRGIIPGAAILHEKHLMRSWTVECCRRFNMHPVVSFRPKRFRAEMLLSGTLEAAWRAAIRIHFRKKKKVCREAVYIVHAGCSVKQLEFIVDEIQKQVPVERFIIQKASFTSASHVGMGGVGIAYYSL